MEKQFIIDDNNKIYDVSNLPDGDGVKEFMIANLTPITQREINEQKKDIINSYYGEDGKPRCRRDGYEVIFEYENDDEFNSLEWLEEKMEDAEIININDEIYKKFYPEAKQFGFCG